MFFPFAKFVLKAATTFIARLCITISIATIQLPLNIDTMPPFVLLFIFNCNHVLYIVATFSKETNGIIENNRSGLME